MRTGRLILLPLLLMLCACVSQPYPYQPQFVASEEVSPNVLPQPPQPYSKTYNNEIDTIIALQADLSEKDKRIIAEEARIEPQMIVNPVLGKRYSEEKYPALYALLRHAGSDAWRISDHVEDFWHSPRPWYADARVMLLVPAITRPGYPSGHTTTNTVWAYVLADLFPSKRYALLNRAGRIGYHRILGGAHFPHDVAAGKILAKAIYTRMKQTPEYKKELAAAKRELRKMRRTSRHTHAKRKHMRHHPRKPHHPQEQETPRIAPLTAPKSRPFFHFLTDSWH